MSAASLRALSMPELVDNVLSRLEPHDLMRPALVSRLWAETARNYIWRDVMNARALFRTLAPSNQTNPLDFSRVPRPSDWQSFLHLSRHVRTLDLFVEAGAGSELGGISSSSFNIFTTTRPESVELFPKLTHLSHMDLDPSTDPERSLLFLTPNIRTLDILVPVASARYSCNEIFEDIVSRCPRLEALMLWPAVKECTPADVQKGLCLVLQKLPLKKLTLPPYYISASLLSSAANCATLRVLSAITSSDQIRLDDYRHAQGLLMPSLPPHPFPVLTNLDLASPIHIISSMLGDASSPLARLTSFQVRAVQTESSATIRDLLVKLSTHCCRRLTRLSLILSRPHRLWFRDQEVWPEPPEDGILPFVALRQMRLPFLRSLEIVHDYALSLTDDDLITLATNLPRLTELQLNATPSHPEFGQPSLTLHALHRIAPKLPGLKSLSLMVDAKRTTGLDTADVKPLKALAYIFLCWSPIEENAREPVVRFLKRVLPADVMFDTDQENLHSWDCSPFMNKDVRANQNIWEEVRAGITAA